MDRIEPSAEQFVRELLRRVREVAREEAQRLIQGVVQGGRIPASKISGSVPGTAPNDAEYIVATPSGALTAERLLGDVIQRGPLAGRPSPGIPGRLYYATDAATLYRDSGSAWESVEGAGGGGGGGILRSSYATRPTPGTAGRLWLQSDGPYMAYDDGTTWQEYAFGFPVRTAGFPTTWLNQGGATVNTSRGGVNLWAPAAAGWNVRALIKAAPTPPYTITTLVLLNAFRVTYHRAGLLWYESSSGKLTVHSIQLGEGIVQISQLNSVTSWNSNVQGIGVSGILWWLRFQDNGTERICLVSTDGIQWHEIYRTARTTWLTPTHVGIFLNAENSLRALSAWFLSWEESP